MDAAEVLLLTTEVETAKIIQQTLRAGSTRTSAEACKGLVQLRARVNKPASQGARRIAIIDIDENAQAILFDLNKLIAVHPDVVFVVVSREFNEKLVLQAMQAGARHFLRKSEIATELGTVLDRLLLQDRHGPTRLGHVVTVFSSSGGCGATTVAVNLAAELREKAEQRVLLIDLDPHYGSVAHYLNIQGKYGIAHILGREGAIDRHLIQSSATAADDRLDVLLSPAVATSDAGTAMNYGNLLRTLEACRETHDYVVVDAPRLPAQAVADLATATSVAVVVLRLTVRDVAFARRLIGSLTEHGMSSDRILALANQAARRGPLLRPREVERVLGEIPLLQVRSDVKKAVRSLSQGLPLAHFARRSGLRRDLRRIAGQVQKWTSNGHPGKGGA